MSLGNREAAIKVPHSSVFDAESVKIDMGLLSDVFQEFAYEAHEMHVYRVTDSTARKWYAELLSGRTNLDDEEVDRYATESRLFRNVWNGYKEGKGAEETLWGLLNGLTYTVDHIRGHNIDNRIDSKLFGTGAALKERAYKKAIALI